MKIVSLFYILLSFFSSLVSCFQMENSNSIKASVSVSASVSALNSNQNTNNLNIFDALSKHKLKAKGKKLLQNSPSQTDQVPKKQALAIKSIVNPASAKKPFVDRPLKEGPLLWSGWVKFHTYSNLDGKKLEKDPSNMKFFTNPEFNEQMKIATNLNIEEKDGKDFKYVHDEFQFWCTVFPLNINFSSNRIQADQTIYDTLSLKRLVPIEEKNGFTGGVFLLPNKNTNEYCVKLDLLANDYVICTTDKTSIVSLAGTIKQTAINNQRAEGQILLGNSPPPSTSDLIGKKPNAPEAEANPEGADGIKKLTGAFAKQDGYWVKLQGWSSCTLKCGGGTMSFHRMCVPPRNGGKDCVGESILTKACNPQPCPPVEIPKPDNDGTDSNNPGASAPPMTKEEKEKQKANEPIIKVMPFSNRYQRYTVKIFI